MTIDARPLDSTKFSPAGLQTAAAELRAQSPEEILAWTLRTFPARTAVTVSFGGPGVALAYMASRIEPTTPIVFLDTGFLFPETYALRDELVKRYALNLVEYKPRSDPGPLYETDTDGCCAIRKVEPMQRALGDFDAWVSGVRRDHRLHRRVRSVRAAGEPRGRGEHGA